MNIKYRKATKKDLSCILDILKGISGSTKDVDAKQFLVAVNEDRIIGCIRIQNKNGNYKLASLAVLPDYRGVGIGSYLIKKILAENKKRPIYLFCNKNKKEFYEKFGFDIEENENLPEAIKKDYKDLLNLNFAKNISQLVAMILPECNR